MLDSNHFRRLLSNPETTVEEDLDKLEKLLEEHPYLQSARALQLKMYKQKNSALYNNALRKTAAHTTDRDVLFQFITSELFNEKELDNETIDRFPTEELKDTESKDSELDVPLETKETEIVSLPTEEIKADTTDKSDIKVKHKEKTSEVLVEHEINASEEAKTLEINKPLSFNKKDSYSFSEWMQLTRHEPIDRGTEKKEEKESENGDKKEELAENIPRSTDKVIHLVDAFLKNNPRPKRKSEIFEADESKVLSAQSQAPQSLMTETLARVYLQQKNYKKAIQAYKILILKNPEKSGYFADKIRAIEKIINKK